MVSFVSFCFVFFITLLFSFLSCHFGHRDIRSVDTSAYKILFLHIENTLFDSVKMFNNYYAPAMKMAGTFPSVCVCTYVCPYIIPTTSAISQIVFKLFVLGECVLMLMTSTTETYFD